ncbi:MAG: hypothetical protein M3387_13395 [Actinomycetota bacterium]|nr:hypothetical protein [Actinomycetota bacterium]
MRPRWRPGPRLPVGHQGRRSSRERAGRGRRHGLCGLPGRRHQREAHRGAAVPQYAGYLYGDDTANLIDGKAGNDELSGGDGDHRVYGSGGSDRLFLGQGMDNAIGGCETKVAAP